MHKLCIDIGGSNIRIVIFDQDDKLLLKEKIISDPQNFLTNFNQIKTIIANYAIDIIAIGMPGPADYEQGIIFNPPNLKGWWNLNLKTYFAQLCQPEAIFFQNDASLMALANHFAIGATKDDISQFFTVSTGLGGGLIINNEIFKGANNHAQEIAHLPINSSSEENHLSPGALEYFSAGSGIAKRGKKYGYPNTESVFKAYEQDKNAQQIIDQGISGLAHAIAASAALINPNKIIFDGSLARIHPWYVEKAIKEAKSKMFIQQSQDFTTYISTLGDDSVIKGCLNLINTKLAFKNK